MGKLNLQPMTFGNTNLFGQDTPALRVFLPTPGRLNAEQTARVLGMEEHDIPVLVRFNLLKPLGNPKQSAQKHFAAVHVLALAQNPDWLHKASHTLYQHWASKNAGRRKLESETAVIEA
jgi:hypothetical protein